MASLKAHFDGRSIVLDEPASLTVGQAVRVIVDTTPDAGGKVAEDTERDTTDMNDDELAEWLEVETHRLRGVPYNPHSRDGR